MDKINNKNAREKALLEEAYGNVYKEGVNYGDTSGGAARRASAHRKQLQKAGAVRLQSPDGTSRATLPKGDPKIEELEAQGYKRIDIEDEQNPDADTYDAQGEEPAEMVSLNRNEEEEYTAEHHDKFVKIAHEALGRIAGELHVGEYQEAFDINELTDGHNQLSAALIALLGEEQAKDIMGGQAARQAAAGSQPEQFTPMEFPSDEEY